MSTGNPALVLCVGPQRQLQLAAVARLKSQWIAPGFEETDFVSLENPTEEDTQALLEAIRTAPFGSPCRLVVADGINQLQAKDFPWLEDYLKGPNPKAILVFCAREMKTKGGLPAAWLRSKQVERIECQALQGRVLQDWIRQQAKELGKEIELPAVSLLVARIGEDLTALRCALESLTLLAESEPGITPTHVKALIPPSYQETAFEILDSAASGKLGHALDSLRVGKAQGRLSLEQFFGALGWYYRMIWKTKQGGRSPGWISPGRRQAIHRIARWPAPKLERALLEVLEADSRIKQGHPAPELLADQLLTNLAS